MPQENERRRGEKKFTMVSLVSLGPDDWCCLSWRWSELSHQHQEICPRDLVAASGDATECALSKDSEEHISCGLVVIVA